MSTENGFFGGASTGCGLKKYLMKKHPKFYEMMLDECVDHAGIGTYANRGNISFIIPSAESMKSIEKAEHEDMINKIKSHILRLNISDPREFSRFKKENEKEQLGNGLYVRLTVKEVKGPVITFDNGVEIKFDSKHDGFSIYELKKGIIPTDGEKVSKENEYGQAHKGEAPAKKGGYSGGEYSGGDYTKESKKEFIRTIIIKYCSESEGPKLISSYYLSLVNFLKNKDPEEYARVFALTFDSGSLADILLALYVVRDDLFDEWAKMPVERQSSSSLIRQKLEKDWSLMFKISCAELCALVSDFRDKKLKDERNQGSNRDGMFKWVTEMYQTLSYKNTLRDKEIYQKCVSDWLASNSTFKGWSDCTRYFIDWSVFQYSKPEHSNVEEFEADIISHLSDAMFRNPSLLNKDVFDNVIDRKKSFINFYTFVRYEIPVFPRISTPSSISASEVDNLVDPRGKDNVSQPIKLREYIGSKVVEIGGGGYFGGNDEWVDGFVSCLSDEGKEALKKYLCGESAESSSSSSESTEADE